ncbi:hypothetical protein [Aliivibrio salmonicida]
MEGQVVRWIDNKGFGFIRGMIPIMIMKYLLIFHSLKKDTAGQG